MTTAQICSNIDSLIARMDNLIAGFERLEQERKEMVTATPAEVTCPF